MPKIVVESTQIPCGPVVRIFGEKMGGRIVMVFYPDVLASLITTRLRSDRVVLKKGQRVPVIVFQS